MDSRFHQQKYQECTQSFSSVHLRLNSVLLFKFCAIVASLYCQDAIDYSLLIFPIWVIEILKEFFGDFPLFWNSNRSFDLVLIYRRSCWILWFLSLCFLFLSIFRWLNWFGDSFFGNLWCNLWFLFLSYRLFSFCLNLVSRSLWSRIFAMHLSL